MERSPKKSPPSQYDSGRASASGAVLVEFAIILPLLLLLISATFDLAYAIRVADVISQAARHGARSGAAYSASPTFQNCPIGVAVLNDIKCDQVNTLPSQEISSQIARASCRYMALSGLNQSAWKVRMSGADGGWDNQENGTKAQLIFVRVEISSDPTRVCLFCWQRMFKDLLLTAESRFLAENVACTNVYDQ